MSKPEYRCSHCNGTNVEICKPAWFNPNDGWEFVEEDSEAEPLNTHCNDCGDNRDLVLADASGTDRTIAGRWS